MAMSGFTSGSIINLMQPWTNEEHVIKMFTSESITENTDTNIETSNIKLIQAYLIPGSTHHHTIYLPFGEIA